MALDGGIRQNIHLEKAESKQILLCSPPRLSWHAQKGYWPCAYNWTTVCPDWIFRDYLECKKAHRVLLRPQLPGPQLPSWLPGGSDLRLSETLSRGRYTVNGVLLFEQPGESAFVVVWGSVPESAGQAAGTVSGQTDSLSGQSESPWWKSESGYFCCVVDWEELIDAPYLREDVNIWTWDWHFEKSAFAVELMRICGKTLVARPLEASTIAHIGPGTRVEARVGNRSFLGVDGVLVDVHIGRRGS